MRSGLAGTGRAVPLPSFRARGVEPLWRAPGWALRVVAPGPPTFAMSRITADDVRKVAQLARLDLPEAAITTYTTQLERILDYVAQLQAVDTEGVPPTTRAVEVVNVTREDRVEPTPVREQLLDLAPQREGDFFRVPKILAD